MAVGVTKRDVAINSLIVDTILISSWLCALAGLIWRFNQRHNISRVLQATSVLFIVFYVTAWITWTSADIIYFTNGSSEAWRTCMLLYSIVKYLLPSSAFYIFILSRLKMTFQGTMFEIPSLYFIVVGIAGSTSLLLNTWWRVYGFAVTPQEFYRHESLMMFQTFCQYQFYFVDMMLQFSMIIIFEHRLFQLMSVIREEIDPISGSTTSSAMGNTTHFNDRQKQLLKTNTKHFLLTFVMVMSNMVWMLWSVCCPIKSQPFTRDDMSISGWTIADGYVYLVLNSLQLISLYLGFDFGNPYYDFLCGGIHGLCEGVCKRIAVRTIKVEMKEEKDKYLELGNASSTESNKLLH